MGISYSRVAQPLVRESSKVSKPNYSRPLDATSDRTELALTESVFHSMLTLERRRAERSRKPFVLMLLDANLENGSAIGILKNAFDVVTSSMRETDLAGWYKDKAIIGVIFTEINTENERPITDILRTKIETALAKHLGPKPAAKIAISLHMFPESWNSEDSGWVADSKLYPDLDRKAPRKRLPLVVKCAMEIACNATSLLVLSPVRAVIAAVIRLTSKDPVDFARDTIGN
jgi:hypothetical protein